MINRRRKNYIKAIIAFWIILTIFLIFSDYIVIKEERNLLLKSEHKRITSEMNVLKKKLREAYNQKEYSLIENYVQKLCKEHRNLDKIKVYNPDKYVLAEFSNQKDIPREYVVNIKAKINYQDKHILTVEFFSNIMNVEEEINRLKWSLIKRSALLALMFGIITWIILKALALVPLEQELLRRIEGDRTRGMILEELDKRDKAKNAEITSANMRLRSEISERSKTEEALRKSEKKYRDLFEETSDAILIIEDNKFVDCNNATVKMLRYKNKNELLQTHPSELSPETQPDGRKSYEKAEEMMKNARANGNHRFEWIHRRADGEDFPVEVLLTSIQAGDKHILYTVWRDITEKKKQEKERQEYLEYLENLEKIDRIINQTKDLDKSMEEVIDQIRRIYQSDRAWLIFPCDPENDTITIPYESTVPEFPGANINNDALPMTDSFKEYFRKALSEQKTVVCLKANDPDSENIMQKYTIKSIAYIAVHPKLGKPWLLGLHQCNYERIWTESELKLFVDIANRISNALTSLIFFQNLQKSQADLRESQENYRLIAENIDEVFWIGTPDWNEVDFISPAYEKVWGKSCQSLYDNPHSWMETVSEEHKEQIQEIINNRDMNSTDVINFPEYQITRPDGLKRWVHARAFPVTNENNEVVKIAGIAEDITQSKMDAENRIKLERQIQHSQKLESLGSLAGGIAHDFNNLLMGVLGNADLALMEIESESDIGKHLQEIKKTTYCATDLCNQMLAYAGKGNFIIKPVNINVVINEMEHLLKVSVSKSINLNFVLGEDLPAINADINQLRQIVLNLVINASEAIQVSSGNINIITTCGVYEEEYLRNLTYVSENIKAGEYIAFEVMDNGCGMDSKTIGRIFDPFYTTKFTGRGLGLAAVQGIVRIHNGAIKIDSSPGDGTNFKIFFPTTDKPAENIIEVEEKTSDWKGNGSILLVDDEKIVRDIVKMYLEKLGFDPVVVKDGYEAIKIFKNNYDKIKVVLLDMTMPGLNGYDVYNELKAINENVLVIMCSGYNELDSNNIHESDLAGFIQKPFRFDVLKEKLKHTLSDKDK